ncbi:MJ1255/VC2487 family glycosyltransferase [Shewanella mangrovi]|uniref:MJ1255/VC2487 family glycosyltransferase n=1 Tax=Shewanella mangrovi TaxID=1515746 RepID=UPI00068D11BD|nr:MJ1255/VC2487 family glycosyltransferase [Shewanella mangrovi]
MRILYGVQGTGNGHLSRARVMARALAEHNVEVDYLFSGRAADKYFDMEPFGDYRVLPGLSFATRKGRVNVAATVKENSLLRLWRDIRRIDVTDYDLVLNDFEPITAWAARRQGVQCISISHQAALRYPVPKVGNSWFNDWLLENFAPADLALGCHWHHFGYPILPPFVEVDNQEKTHADEILVYLPFEAAPEIADLLAPFAQCQFHVYHAAPAPYHLPEHIHWHGFNRDGFKRAMGRCSGVIGNAGFELASEAMTLGKKLLVKPLMGQFEQLSNVAALELLAAAEHMHTLDGETLKRWLKSSNPQPIRYPDVGDMLVRWLLAKEWHDPQALCQALWQRVVLPDSWASKRDNRALGEAIMRSPAR